MEKKYSEEELIALYERGKISILEYVEWNETYSDLWKEYTKTHPRTVEEVRVFLDKFEEELHGVKDHGLGIGQW